MSYDLTNFGLAEMLQCGRGIRLAAAHARTMERIAAHTTRFLHSECIDPGTKGSACALVRFYKTHPYSGLLPADQAFARNLLGGGTPAPGLKCLTLLATAGDEPAWNSRSASRGHRAIPLASVQMVEGAPMIAALIRQFGLPIEAVVSPPKMADSLAGKTYNVFHVPAAEGSPYIPAQDFVRQHGIRSVVGCGGVLLTGDFFALILFSRVSIDAESAARFRNIALDLKLAVSPFATVFDPVPAEPAPAV